MKTERTICSTILVQAQDKAAEKFVTKIYEYDCATFKLVNKAIFPKRTGAEIPSSRSVL